MSDPSPTTAPTCGEADIATCLRVLRAVAESSEPMQRQEEVERLVAKVYKKARKLRRKKSLRQRIQRDRNLVHNTGRVKLERGETGLDESFGSPGTPFSPLKARSRRCYMCKRPYREVHRFYHMLCPACASLNEAKRDQQVDLRGRQALVTGGRIKIGYQTALKLLRWGASVTVTSRFPRDAIARFSAEGNFGGWKDRLQVVGADFRDVPALLRLVDSLKQQLPALDILVNNAAQSVRRPPEYLGQLQRRESELSLSANHVRLLNVQVNGSPPRSAALADGPRIEAAPALFDRHGEIVDRREEHGWTWRLAEVQPLELLESLLINANAPCLLTSGLKPLFLQSPFPDRYVINVTGLDGRFGSVKTTRHPHVNMSKAALNMLTRTSAADYAVDGIYMNSVDTGWITHEASFSRRTRMSEAGFAPPLDEVDGAARILDPVVQGLCGAPQSGLLYRHYEPSSW